MTVNTPPHVRRELGRVRAILSDQDTWRRLALNLIASENLLSPAARAVRSIRFSTSR